MALPPILNVGSKFLKDKIVRDVVTGRKHICLAISEPGAGSDVAAIATTAVKSPDGKSYGECGGRCSGRRPPPPSSFPPPSLPPSLPPPSAPICVAPPWTLLCTP
jgi:hypothetical protein